MSKGTVLVIEDNPDILEAVRLLLEQAEFNVLTAEECFTGISHLQSYQPDVILTDIGLPEMSGLEFIRLIRNKKMYSHIPIVAMTGYDKAYLVTAVKAGADAAVHKPEDIDDLAATIQQVIDKGVTRKNVH